LGVLDARQGLGEKICNVDVASHVLHPKLSPLDAVLEPVKSHVYAFRQARSHRLVGQAHGTLIVAE
jgi:hypothetical protein